MAKRTAADPLAKYLSEVQHNLSSGIACEQTHRHALEDLIESLDPTIDAFNDPQHIEVGAPDFTIRRKGHATDFPVGWIRTRGAGEGDTRSCVIDLAWSTIVPKASKYTICMFFGPRFQGTES